MLSLNFPSLDEQTLVDVLNQNNGNYALAIRTLNQSEILEQAPRPLDISWKRKMMEEVPEPQQEISQPQVM